MRACLDEVPAVVLRPCAVIGDSSSGRTRTFNVIYYPLKLLSRGLLRVLPGSARTPIDLVPVDYVADAANHIMLRADCTGKTYHLTAGPGAVTIGTIARLAVKHLNASRGSGDPAVAPVRFIPHWVFQALLKPALKAMYGARGSEVMARLEVYLPYLTKRKHFDTTNAIEALRGTGIAPPDLESYFGRVVRYCRETDWGRSPGDAASLAGGASAGRASLD
ncbi:MAG: SDR family oxidoreductase [Myxococcota bacterium]